MICADEHGLRSVMDASWPYTHDKETFGMTWKNDMYEMHGLNEFLSKSSEDFVPSITDLNLVTKAYWVTDKESFESARKLLCKEGILAGSSSGALIATALKWCHEQSEPKRVVTFACDHGSKYLNKMFNDYWMIDQGFIEREQHCDLRDLITRRHDTSEHSPTLLLYLQPLSSLPGHLTSTCHIRASSLVVFSVPPFLSPSLPALLCV